MGSGVSFADPESQWEEFAEIYDENPEKWEVFRSPTFSYAFEH